MADIVDIDAAKLFVGFDASVDSADLMEMAQLAGNRQIRNFLGWDPVMQEVTDILSGYNAPGIMLRRGAVKSITKVVIGDVDIPLSSFAFQDRMLFYRTGVFPRAIMNVAVTYKSGYQPLPPDLVSATNIAIKAVWGAFRLDPNFASHSIAGVESAVIQADGAGALPPGVMSMVRYLRLVFVP